MCSIDFSPFSFTQVSSRKNRHGRTEKLCLRARMRVLLVWDVAGLLNGQQLPWVLARLRH